MHINKRGDHYCWCCEIIKMSDSTESFTKKAMVVHHHHHHHHEVEPSSTVTAVSSAGMSGNGCSGREKTLTVCVILLAVFSFGLLAFVIVSWPLSALLAPVSKVVHSTSRPFLDELLSLHLPSSFVLFKLCPARVPSLPFVPNKGKIRKATGEHVVDF